MTTRPITAFADHELRNSPAEPHHHLVQAHVLGVAEIAPHLRRIELTSPDFHDWTMTGPDEFFGLVMPPEHLNTTSAFSPCWRISRVRNAQTCAQPSMPSPKTNVPHCAGTPCAILIHSEALWHST